MFDTIKHRNVILAAILLSLFLSLHLIGLHTQEFNGDEAAPMLLIDRMLDVFNTRDPRFLAYPFLFYSDPFRAFIPGVLLHLFGPNRILLRLPGIIEAFATVGVMYVFLKKQKVSFSLTFLAISAYAFSGVIINNRTAGGDSLMRLAFLSAVFLLIHASAVKQVKIFLYALIAWTVAFFTMLNAVVLIPLFIWVGIKLRIYKNRLGMLLIVLTGLLIGAYIFCWLYFPYQAYVSGIQEHFINRGLFYYLVRATHTNAIPTIDPFVAIIKYTSPACLLWLLWAGVYQLRVKEYALLRWTHFFIWLFVFSVHHSSFHIIMFLPVLVIHATLMTAKFMRRNTQHIQLSMLGLGLVIVANVIGMSVRYRYAFIQQTVCQTLQHPQLDESVRRIYARHSQSPLYQPCAHIVQ